MSKDKRKHDEPAPALEKRAEPEQQAPYWARLAEAWKWLPYPQIAVGIAQTLAKPGGPQSVYELWLNGYPQMRGIVAGALSDLIREVVATRGAAEGAAGVVEAAGKLPRELFPLLNAAREVMAKHSTPAVEPPVIPS